jgi:hypothetical protein
MDKQNRSHASVDQPPDSPKQPPARVQASGGLAIGEFTHYKKGVGCFTLYYMQQVREDTWQAQISTIIAAAIGFYVSR